MNEQTKQGVFAPVAEYALGFHPERVVLMRKSASGWAEIGDARFDAPDLRGALAALRQQLDGEAPAGHTLRLVIPDDQILYTRLTLAPAPNRVKAVRNALEGLTPYAVSELAFDWQDDAAPDSDGAVRVAAVARQTLTEAEDFARRHGFKPDSFLAMPEATDFPRPPSFGQTRFAEERQASLPLPTGAVNWSAPDDAEVTEPAIGTEPADEADLSDTTDAPWMATAQENQTPRDAGFATAEAAHDAASENGATSAGKQAGATDMQQQADPVAADDTDNRPASAAEDATEQTAPPANEPSRQVDLVAEGDKDKASAAAVGAETDIARSPQPERLVEDAPMPPATGSTDHTTPTAETTPDNSGATDGQEETASLTPDSAGDTAPEAPLGISRIVPHIASTPAKQSSKPEPITGMGIVTAQTIRLPDDPPEPAEFQPQDEVAETPQAIPAQAAAIAAAITAPRQKQIPARAQAVLDRAAEARRNRAVPPPVPRQPGGRSGLRGALPLTGALLVGLMLVWAFLPGQPEAPETATTEATQAPAPQTATAPVAPATSEVQTAANTPAAQNTAAQVPATAAPRAPAPDNVAAREVPASALTPEERAALLANPPSASQTATTSGAIPTDSAAVTAESARPTVTPGTTAPDSAAALTADRAPSTATPETVATATSEGTVRAATAENAPSTAAPESAATMAADNTTSTAATMATTAAPLDSGESMATARPEPAPQPAAPVTTTAPAPRTTAAPPQAAPATGALLQSARPASRPARQQAAPAQTPRSAATAAAATAAAPAPRAANTAAPTPRPQANTTARAPGAPASATLRSSSRPQAAPSRPQPASTPDPRPQTPPSPAPFERASQPEVTGERPPSRPARQSMAPVTGPRFASAVPLSAGDHARMMAVLSDPFAAAVPLAAPFAPYRVAQARPPQRPGGTVSDAVDAAVSAAMASTAPAPRPTTQQQTAAATQPARTSGGLSRSPRPAARPGARQTAASPSTAGVGAAVAAALAQPSAPAVTASSGATALSSSLLPRSRPGGLTRSAPAAPARSTPAANPAPARTATPAPAAPAATPNRAQTEAAALAERRRMDEELQRQAEQRIRERAASDARARTNTQAQQQAAQQAAAQQAAQQAAAQQAAQQAAAQQAAAQQAAQQRQQQQRRQPAPQAAPSGPAGAEAAGAARGQMDLNQTQLIGIVGAGASSRGLVRMRNGDVVTVRVGDRLNNGTITAIGTEGVTYNRGGQLYRLPILQGR